jgi:hypothetical protein
MIKVLDLTEKLIAILGVVLCLVAGAVRLTGTYHLAGIETITLFVVGMGVMLVAVLFKLHLRT